MALTVAHNGAAAVATRYLEIAERNTTRALTRLSAGTRVVSARDDAASLAIGSRLNAEVHALRQGATNARQAASMLQIADGAAAQIGDILTRLKTLSVQSGSGQLSNTERSMLDTEFQALKSEIDRISRSTQFNGQGLVDDGGIVFTLRQIPQNGTISLNGEELRLNGTFTLADVQRGRVTYTHSGVGTSDGLVVSVSKSDGTALGTVVGETDSTSFETGEYLASTGLDNIWASTAYARGGTGAGLKVAVIDTGVDLYHTDLDDQVVDGVDIVDGALEGGAATAGTTSGDGNDTNDGNASDGHGTHVAGIIAGERNDTGTMGVAYEADLIAIKATQPSGASAGRFDPNDLADAIDYARLSGAKVINMSLGFDGIVPVPNQITAAMVRAINAGVVIVAATGNAALENPAFPASFAIDPTAKGALIAVGATDDQNQIASFSNLAGVAQNYVVVAPGVNIGSAQYNGGTTPTSNTVALSGTSMATPHVAGAVAILAGLYGSGTESNLSGAELANLVFSTATDLGEEGVDAIFGHGLLNLDKATLPQLKLSINVTPSSLVSTDGELSVASGRTATLSDILFSVIDAYESFTDSPANEMTFKVGSGTEESDELTVSTRSLSTLALEISETAIDSVADANDASTRIDAAIARLSNARSDIGSSQNRLEFAAGNVDVAIENMEQARSGLMDLDVAAEMTVFTSQNLLQQMGVSALSQAQQAPRNLLQLFS